MNELFDEGSIDFVSSLLIIVNMYLNRCKIIRYLKMKILIMKY